MILFWIGLTVFGLMIGIILTWPILRRHKNLPVSRFAHELQIYRAQLAEMERDLASGLVPESQAEAARIEIERRILNAAAGHDSSTIPSTEPQNGSVFLVPVLAIAALTIYLVIGMPGAPGMPLAERLATQIEIARKKTELSGEKKPNFVKILAQLHQHVQEKPEDPEAWRWWGRTLVIIGLYGDAIAAYRQALIAAEKEQKPKQIAEISSALGEALTHFKGGEITPTALQAFTYANKQNPDDIRARYFIALAAAQQGRLQVALEGWQLLLAETKQEQGWQEILTEDIHQAMQALKLDPDSVMLSTEQQQEIATLTPQERSDMIADMVAGLQARLDEDPSDFQGWLRLIRSRSVLGQKDQAQAALATAYIAHPQQTARLNQLAAQLNLDIPTQ